MDSDHVIWSSLGVQQLAAQLGDGAGEEQEMEEDEL